MNIRNNINKRDLHVCHDLYTYDTYIYWVVNVYILNSIKIK